MVGGLSSTTISAQSIGTIEDYFYPIPVEMRLVNDSQRQLVYQFSGRGLTEIVWVRGNPVAQDNSYVEITDNEVIQTHSRGNLLSNRPTMLKLPDPGKTVTWRGRTNTYTATLVNLQIELDGVKTSVFAIKTVSNRTNIEYWAKDYGLIFDIVNNRIFAYNSILSSLSYRETPLDVREIERQQREAERQRIEAEYQKTIESANRNFERKQYAQAKLDYQNALQIKPSEANFINSRIREIERLEELELRYKNTIASAKRKFEQRQYVQAKQDYQAALQIKPENATFVNSKIAEIDRMFQFLVERKSRTYDYAVDFASDYKTVNDKIIAEMKQILADEKRVNIAIITINAVIDTTGIVSTTFFSTIRNTSLNNQLKQIADKIQLKPPTMNGYTVSAKADFEYTVYATENMKVNWRNEGLFRRESLILTDGNRELFQNIEPDIAKLMSDNGKYKIKVTEFQSKNNSIYEPSILKYKNKTRILLELGLSFYDMSEEITLVKLKIGVTDIGFSNFGLYGSFGGGFTNENATEEMKQLYAGITLSTGRSIVFYGGAGRIIDSEKNNYLAAEIGMMLKVIRINSLSLYISSEFDYVIDNNKPYFGIGCGLMF